ncbi:MAG: hypothetical protein J0M24_05495 [Verrucomicrobia bacterium]|nr:hypothetical protein [Verrucomicrobiota bacterium]
MVHSLFPAVWVRWLGVAALMCGGSLAARGQSPLPIELPVTASSHSGQFLVQSRGPNLPPPTPNLTRVGTNELVTLRADLLAVTAERVKQAVDRRLDVQDAWRSRIYIQMRDANRLEGRLSIRAESGRDGWQFFVPVPDRIEWPRLVRTLVEVVLLERANRHNTGGECALVPLWLTEGLYQLILAEEGRDLVAESATVLNRSRLKPDSLAPARAQLRGKEPMPFSELSLLTFDQLKEPARFQEFQATATLLTYEFVRTDWGQEVMRRFLAEIPRCLNWQTALLRASGGEFQSLLDVEKWWAVSATDTLTTDPTQRWPRERILKQLEDLRFETTEVRVDTNSPAVPKVVPLADVLVNWDYETQREVLNRKVTQWRMLAMRAAPELAPLCGDYAKAVHDYVRARDRAGLGPTARGSLEARGNLLATSTARRLEELDRRLEAERSRVIQAPSSAQFPNDGQLGLRPMANPK